jgi:hypothetical protein
MERTTRTRTSAAGLTGAVAVLLAWLRRRRREQPPGDGDDGTGAEPGCCTPDVGAWPGPPDWAEDGRLTNVAGFTSFVTAQDPCWRHYPVSSALAVIGSDPASTAPQQTVTVDRAPSAGSGEVEVTLTFEVEKDDSVRGVRYRLTFVDEGFTGGTAGSFRLLDGVREVRCQPGRGQQDWGTALCL